MALQEAKIQKLDNGYVVILTTLEYDVAGGPPSRQPVQSAFIASTLDEAVDLIKKVA